MMTLCVLAAVIAVLAVGGIFSYFYTKYKFDQTKQSAPEEGSPSADESDNNSPELDPARTKAARNAMRESAEIMLGTNAQGIDNLAVKVKQLATEAEQFKKPVHKELGLFQRLFSYFGSVSAQSVVPVVDGGKGALISSYGTMSPLSGNPQRKKSVDASSRDSHISQGESGPGNNLSSESLLGRFGGLAAKTGALKEASVTATDSLGSLAKRL